MKGGQWHYGVPYVFIKLSKPSPEFRCLSATVNPSVGATRALPRMLPSAAHSCGQSPARNEYGVPTFPGVPIAESRSVSE